MLSYIYIYIYIIDAHLIRLNQHATKPEKNVTRVIITRHGEVLKKGGD